MVEDSMALDFMVVDIFQPFPANPKLHRHPRRHSRRAAEPRVDARRRLRHLQDAAQDRHPECRQKKGGRPQHPGEPLLQPLWVFELDCKWAPYVGGPGSSTQLRFGKK